MEFKRKTQSLDGLVPSRSLIFLYKNKLGRFFLRLMISRSVSKICGAFLSSPLSKPMIKRFVKKNKIDLSEYEKQRFFCFNDCFSRQIKSENRPVCLAKTSFLSVADSKLLVYKITPDLKFKIKNAYYDVKGLVGSDELSKLFCGGYALVFRLCVDDYHRYSYPASGEIVYNRFIKGRLHTVQPIALEKDDFFKENSREVTLIKSDFAGDIAQIEVGAMLVGKIVNHKTFGRVEKGEEKGYFKYGGSTVVLLVQKDKIKLDDDIVQNTKNNLETFVKCNETIAEIKTV